MFLTWELALGRQNLLELKPGDTEPSASATDSGLDHWFERGRRELMFSNGVLFSPVIAIGHRPTINYTMTEVEYGYMLRDAAGDDWWRGNFELIGEALAGWIFIGDGSWIAGGTLWLRYNFVQPDSHFVPFAQAGAGMVSTDISHKIDGQPFNFNLEWGVGVRYLLDHRWSLNLELRYQHISNANTGRHNLGVNAIGPIVGISYLF